MGLNGPIIASVNILRKQYFFFGTNAERKISKLNYKIFLFLNYTILRRQSSREIYGKINFRFCSKISRIEIYTYLFSLVYNYCDCYVQGPGAENFFEAPAPAPLLFNQLWLRLQFQICSGNFTFQFEILICNIYY